MALEPLAIAIRANKAVEGIEIKNNIIKLRMYAHNVIGYLTNPIVAFNVLRQVLEEFGLISSYKINQDKSILKRLSHLTQNMEKEISEIMLAKWSKREIRYLGILTGRTNEEMVEKNTAPLIVYAQEKCQDWRSYPLSLLGRIATVKMILLPNILFLFLNVILDLPIKVLNKIQGILNRFIWEFKRVHILL